MILGNDAAPLRATANGVRICGPRLRSMNALVCLAISLVPLLYISLVGGCAAPPEDIGPSVTLSWDAPSKDAFGVTLLDIASYNIYFGTVPGLAASDYNHVRSARGTESMRTITHLTEGEWYFRMETVDSQGNRSELTSEIPFSIAPPP